MVLPAETAKEGISRCSKLFCLCIIPKHIAVCISNLGNTIIEVRKRDMIHHLAVVWRIELNLHAVR